MRELMGPYGRFISCLEKNNELEFRILLPPGSTIFQKCYSVPQCRGLEKTLLGRSDGTLGREGWGL